MQVPKVDREHLAGNHVLLRCANGDARGGAGAWADVLVGHLRPGSLQVPPGANVAVGDWLGSVGNSGNTGEPHLLSAAVAPHMAVPLLGYDVYNDAYNLFGAALNAFFPLDVATWVLSAVTLVLVLSRAKVGVVAAART